MKRGNAALKRKMPGAAEARQVDFDELPSYVGYQVRRAQAKIFAEFEAALGELDFTPGSFGVLTLIRANPGITQVALAAAFGVDKSTMSPVIFRLEKRGLDPARGAGERPALPCAVSAGGGGADVPGGARDGPRTGGWRGGAADQGGAARAVPVARQAAGSCGRAVIGAIWLQRGSGGVSSARPERSCR